MRIDLNVDCGEGFGPWRMGDDTALFEIVSSANIACGFHAGDPVIMEQTVRMALANGVDIGAHVGFPDLQGFGRRRMHVETDELAAMVVYQLGALAGITRSLGGRMTHMSFHGALGNMAAADVSLAEPLIRAVARFDAALVVLTSASAAIEGAAAAAGLRIAMTFLADRAYDSSGLLVPRSVPGSVIHDEGLVLERIRLLLGEGVVITHEGERLAMPAQSILVHSDTPGAVALARTVRREIEAAGGAIAPLTQLMEAT